MILAFIDGAAKASAGKKKKKKLLSAMLKFL